MTPLLFAALKGNPSIIDKLIRSGAIVDLPAIDGATPLWMAVSVTLSLSIIGYCIIVGRLKHVDKKLILN